MPKVLIIEASRGIRNTLRERLEYEKYTVEVVATGEEAHDIRDTFKPDVVLSDFCYDYTQQLTVPFIVMSEDISVENAVGSVRAGAWDFIPKPIDMNRLLASVRQATGMAEDVEAEVFLARQIKRRASDIQEIIGSSDSIMHVKRLIDKVGPRDTRVLIMGENGTGKELVARWLHEKSLRSKGPFVEINCAAIPSELIESELFGHEKGAFTSAVRQRKGKFEQADGGTLFMDEIGDMSLSAQAKVLRALQESRISRVGSDKDVPVDARVVAATNKNIREEIEQGRFREDLYHRLSVIIIKVPPLAERPDDIPVLVDHFMKDICDEYKTPCKDLAPDALEELLSMPWRGNIRELRNVMERLIILGESDTVTLEDVRTYVGAFQ